MKIATAEVDSDEHSQNMSKYHLHQLGYVSNFDVWFPYK